MKRTYFASNFKKHPSPLTVATSALYVTVMFNCIKKNIKINTVNKDVHYNTLNGTWYLSQIQHFFVMFE